MPQFGVYPFSGHGGTIRFLIQVQSTRLDRIASRVMMPTYGIPLDGLYRRLAPKLEIAGEIGYADPTNLVTVLVRKLPPLLCVLAESQQDLVMAALDEMTSRA